MAAKDDMVVIVPGKQYPCWRVERWSCTSVCCTCSCLEWQGACGQSSQFFPLKWSIMLVNCWKTILSWLAGLRGVLLTGQLKTSMVRLWSDQHRLWKVFTSVIFRSFHCHKWKHPSVKTNVREHLNIPLLLLNLTWYLLKYALFLTTLTKPCQKNLNCLNCWQAGLSKRTYSEAIWLMTLLGHLWS